MRVRFTRDYDYTPSGERRVTIAYKCGMDLTVKREAGEAAIAASCAEQLEAPARCKVKRDPFAVGSSDPEIFIPASDQVG